MKTILAASGAALINQAYNTAQQVRLSGFLLGNAVLTGAQLAAFEASEADVSTVRGQTVYTGTTSVMSWTRQDTDAVTLFCRVPHNTPSFVVGNVTLLATVGSTTAPLTFSATANGVLKFAPEASGVGLGYTWMCTLAIPGLDDLFDFATLQQRVAEFKTAANERAVGAPYADGHDQFVLTDHTRLGGLHIVVNSDNQHWGCPFALPLDDVDATFVLSGGVRGDGYRRP